MYRSIFLALAVAMVAAACGAEDEKQQAPEDRWQPPAPTHAATLSIEPAEPIPADGAATYSIAFSLVDGADRPLGGVPVAFKVGGGGNTIEAPAATDAGGRAMATLASTRAETKHVSVAAEIDGAWLQVASGWIAFGAGAPTGLSFSYAPSSVNAGAAFTVHVIATDAHGNATRAPLEVRLAAEAVTLEGGTTATTNGQGEARFAGLRIAEPGRVSLVASADGVPPVSTVVQVVPSSDFILVWRSHPATTGAGEQLPPLEISVLDGAYRAIAEPIEVTLELPGVGAGRLEGPTRVTTVAGVARFEELRVLTAGRDFRFVASAPRAVTAESRAFTVVPGEPDEEQSFLYMVGAKAGESGQVLVHIQDALNNPLAGRTVELSSDRADVTIDPPTAITDEWGEARFSAFSTVAGSVTFVAGIGDWEFISPMNIIFANLPDPSRSVILGDGQVGVAGAYLMQFIGLEFQDAWGNPARADVDLQVNDGGTNEFARSSGRRIEWRWRLGAGIGPQSVVAQVSGWEDPVVFRATAQNEWPFSTTLEPAETELLVLNRMPPWPPRVRFLDDTGHPIPDAPIEWAITDGIGTLASDGGQGPSTSWTGPTGWTGAYILTMEGSITVTASGPGAMPVQIRVDLFERVNSLACQYQPGGVQTFRRSDVGTWLEGVYRLYADAEISPGIDIQARFVDQSLTPGIVASRVDALAIGLYDPSSLQTNTLIFDGNGALGVDGTVATVGVGASWTGHPLARVHRVGDRRWRLEYDRATGETDEVWIVVEGGLVTSAILDVARVPGAGGAYGLCGRNDGSSDGYNVDAPRTGSDSLFP